MFNRPPPIVRRLPDLPPEPGVDHLCNLLCDLESGAGVTIMPLAVNGHDDKRAMIIVRVGGAPHGLDAGEARLVARLIADEDARPDAGLIAEALALAAGSAERLLGDETLLKASAGDWSGSWPEAIRRFDPVARSSSEPKASDSATQNPVHTSPVSA